MMRVMIFSLTAMGTIFFCSSLFVDSYLVPKWMILAIGFIFGGLIQLYIMYIRLSVIR